MPKLAVLITTCISTELQERVLWYCIQSVKKYYPDASCIVIDDNSKISIQSVFNKYSIPMTNITIVKSLAPKAGECNAYLWSMENLEEFDTFLFLHDSVVLLNRLPDLEPHLLFKPLWFADCHHTPTGMKDPEFRHLFMNTKVFIKPGVDFYNMILEKSVHITFGAMGMWSSAFAKFLRDETNCKEMLPLFYNRPRRCILERFMSIFFLIVHPPLTKDDIKLVAPCGDIKKHKHSFQNNTFIDLTFANNPYACKIWQGR